MNLLEYLNDVYFSKFKSAGERVDHWGKGSPTFKLIATPKVLINLHMAVVAKLGV